MSDRRLYIFDLDGTLVHDYLRDAPCERCHGEGIVDRNVMGSVETVPCPKCHGRGTFLEPDPEFPYVLPHPIAGVSDKLEDLGKDPATRFGIATNQAGAALGYCTVTETVRRIHRAMQYTIGVAPHVPNTVQICYDHPAAKLEPWKKRADDERVQRMRKPQGGMLRACMQQMGTTPADTLFVGDRKTDEEAAADAGVHFRYAADFFADRYAADFFADR